MAQVVVVWVGIGVIGGAISVLLLFLLISRLGQRLQEHLLRRDGAECHKATPGAVEKETTQTGNCKTH